MRRSKDDARPTSRSALLLAAAVSVVVSTVVPFGELLLYPLTLLATWVHEMGHGVTAILVGGQFMRLEIFAGAGGLAYTATPSRAAAGLVALGGLVAPPIVGAALFVLGRGARRSRVALVVLATMLLFSLVVWVRSFAGLLVVPGLAVIIGAVARWGSPREMMFLVQFIGLRLALDTVTRGIDYAFSGVALVDGQSRPSDIVRVAESLGGPRVMWSFAVTCFSLVLVALGLYLSWRRPASKG